ncbi:MAG: hypothetical protein J3K34DRAFT_417863 [Monoraphidium minutum]|nr:MAG: hypothetical protein J3K34DRAFT_417863 [Monoraphidium minutum]
MQAGRVSLEYSLGYCGGGSAATGARRSVDMHCCTGHLLWQQLRAPGVGKQAGEGDKGDCEERVDCAKTTGHARPRRGPRGAPFPARRRRPALLTVRRGRAWMRQGGRRGGGLAPRCKTGGRGASGARMAQRRRWPRKRVCACARVLSLGRPSSEEGEGPGEGARAGCGHEGALGAPPPAGAHLGGGGKQGVGAPRCLDAFARGCVRRTCV